jgi:hypothetical protein
LPGLGGALWYIFKGRDNVTTTATTPDHLDHDPAAPPPPPPPTSSSPPPPTSTAPPAPALIAVPDVTNKTGDVAETTLKGAGFSKITFVADDGSAVQQLSQWKVTKQTPAAGSSVAATTEIILTVHTIGTGKG